MNEKAIYVEDELLEDWKPLSSLLCVRSETEYDRALVLMQCLVDCVRDDETHPLSSLLDTLGALIGDYESTHHAISEDSGLGALRFLMDEHGVTQSELPEIGSQGVVSEVLGGKRELNLRHIRALAQRFGVSPAVFI